MTQHYVNNIDLIAVALLPTQLKHRVEYNISSMQVLLMNNTIQYNTITNAPYVTNEPEALNNDD